MGFAFCFGNKIISTPGGEVSFGTWLCDLWKLVFACLGHFSVSVWWDAVVTECHRAGVRLLRIRAEGTSSVQWAEVQLCARALQPSLASGRRCPNAWYCFWMPGTSRMLGWFIGSYVPVQILSKTISTSIKISMNQDCSLAILELEMDTIHWINNLLWMVCSSLL